MRIAMDALVVFLMLFLLVIFTVLLIHKGRTKYSNRLLAVYFISQILGVLGNLFYLNFHHILDLQVIVYSIIFCWLPLFYLYIVSLLFSDFRVGWKQIPHFLSSMIVFTILIYLYYFEAYNVKLANLSKLEIYNTLFAKFSIVFNLQVLFYNILILFTYKKYLRVIKQEYSAINHPANAWIKTSIFGFLIACLIVQIGNNSMRFQVFSSVNWFLVGNAAFFVFFNILFYKAIINPDFFGARQTREKYRYSNLNASEANKILQEIEKFMFEKKPFTDAALSLKVFSKMLNIPERQVSQVLNEYKKQNFFDFVNTYRVKYAMELLKTKENSQRTMLDILFDSGFNSKSSFNTSFKKYSGYTPSDFRKMHL